MEWKGVWLLALLCTISAVYSQEVTPVTIGFDPTAYSVQEDGGSVDVCARLLQGSISGSNSFTVTYITQSGTAQSSFDFQTVSGLLTFNAQTPSTGLCATITIIDDTESENDETFAVNLANSFGNSALSLSPNTATITILGSNDGGPTPATIGLQESSYNVNEGDSVLICAQVQNDQELDREITFTYSTTPNTAGSNDYNPVSVTLSFNGANDRQLMCMSIQTIDDALAEGAESFFVTLGTNDADVTLDPGTAVVNIQDNDVANPCNSNPCDVNAICTQVGTTNGFSCACRDGFIGDGVTCVAMGGGDDPHFSIILPSGKLLCFTVQGECDFVFSLISTNRVSINALFVADSVREEVTWMGALGIVVQGENYHGDNKTSLRFDAKSKTVSVGTKLTLQAGGIDSLHFKNGKLMITEKDTADKGQDLEHPSVCVNLEDVGLHFHVTFYGEHLDIFWNTVTIDNEGNKNIHGLVGQFLREKVRIDTTRGLLLLPKMEPVPVMRKPVWAFMEREVKDDQLCWTAMNPGYQGEGLIEGNYFDYLVDDVLAEGFVFKKH